VNSVHLDCTIRWWHKHHSEGGGEQTSMQYIRNIIAGVLCALAMAWAGLPVPAAAGPAHAQVALIGEKTGVHPGETVTVALRLRMSEGWHTYWVYPGDVGEATVVQWKLPDGAQPSDLRWPFPEIIKTGPFVNYGYSGEVLFLTDISLPKTLTGPSLEIGADVSWLACKDVCVPEEGQVRLTLPILGEGVAASSSPDAVAIAEARLQVPQQAPGATRIEAGKTTLALSLDTFAVEKPEAEIHFFPFTGDVIRNSTPQKAVVENGKLKLTMQRGKVVLPDAFGGVLLVKTTGAAGQSRQYGYTINAPVTYSAMLDEIELSFVTAVIFALLGGLILNLMPCVFPVLSLKALSLARERAPHERHVHGVAYLAGVLTSFFVAGLLIIVLRAGGMKIDWGMHFQSPAFVLVLMALFLLLGLNASGVFSVGGRLAGLGDGLTRMPGFTGYFFTGALATVVATPCTAPYMTAAVAYALKQPAPQLLGVLLALGVGFALPMVLLSVSPTVGRWLPKPGAWMQTFKELMAFPLYATVGWLLYVLSREQGSDGVLAGVITLIGVSFAVWLFSAVREPSIWRKVSAGFVAVAVLAYAMTSLSSNSGPRYEPFSQARLEALRAQNKPVFINLTAAWCITCLMNEHMALRSDRIADAFSSRGIVYLKGDWSNRNPEITTLLKSFDRAGVPLYIIYNGKAEPQVLPQFLTENIVLEGIANLPQQHTKTE
jgi:thiol:disulfide interchange protein